MLARDKWTGYARESGFLDRSSDISSMKSLESLFQTLRLQSAIQNRVVVGEPWGVVFPARPVSGKFHFIEVGRGVLSIPGQEDVRLHQGDLAMVFTEGRHTVRDVLETPPTELEDLLRRAQVICASGLSLRFGGDGPETSILSGDFIFEDSGTHPLFRMLPPYILLRGEDGQAPEWLDTTLRLLSQEAMAARPGMTAVLDRLCDVLFIQALRGWIRMGADVEGLPLAVRDPAIDEAIDLMQRFPAQPWTVESLAQRVALSRSTFAERFRRLSGETPMEYLAHWRMHLARRHLGGGQESVARIAERVGYESEAAFAKAFKRTVGLAPGAYRRAQLLG